MRIDGAVAFAGISCTDSSGSAVCVAVDVDGRLLTLRAGAWSGPKVVDKTGQPVAISCANPTTCAFVDAAGYEYRNNTGSWIRAHIDGENGYLSQVACTSPSLCTVVSTDGEAAESSGTAWKPLARSPVSNLTAVSCVRSFCAMGGASGDVVTWAGRWSRISRFGSTDVTGVSCVSATFCMAVDLLGQYSTWNGKTWAAATDIDYPYGRGLGAVACPSRDLCVMTDHTGREIVWRSGRRSAYRLVDTLGGDLTSIACPTITECLAVDAAGYVIATSPTTSGLRLERPRRIDLNGLTSISCGSQLLCSAVDTAGSYLSWHTGVWSVPTTVDQLGYLISISCSSSGTCAALGQNNQVVEGRIS